MMVNRIKNITYYFIPSLMLIFIIPTIFNDSLWVDEVFSLELVKHSFFDIIKIDAMDVHPPLYYLILKAGLNIFTGIFGGNTIYAAKFVSFIPYIMMLILGYTVVKKQYGKRVSFLFMIFITSMPQMAHNAVEIRMYSWGILFVLCAFLSGISILRKKNIEIVDFIFLTIFSILCAYTHYFACISAFVIYLEIIIFSLFKKKYKKFFLLLASGVWVFIAFSPWIIIVVKQMMLIKGSYWIPPLNIKRIVICAGWFLYYKHATIFIFTFVFVGIMGILIKKVKRKYSSFEEILGLLIPVLIIIFALVFQILFRPVFSSRYIFFSLGAFWLSISVGIVSFFKNQKTFSIFCILVCFTGMFINIQNIKKENEFNIECKKTIESFEKLTQNDIVFIYDNSHLIRIFSHYFLESEHILILDAQKNKEEYVYNEAVSEVSKKVFDKCKISSVKSIDELANKTFYFIGDNLNLLKESEKDIKCTDIGDFKLENGSSTSLYNDFNIYKLEF